MAGLNRSHRLAIPGFVGGGLALYRGMPHQMPPGIAIGGHVLWLGAPMTAFLLPFTIIVIDSLLRPLYTGRSWRDGSQTDGIAVYNAFIDRVATFVTGMHVLVLLVLLGALRGQPWLGQVVPVMLGVTIVFIGNLLPKTRPNLAIGLRTRKLLSDRALWIRAHRSLGYLVVGLGTAVVLSALAVPPPAGPGMILVLGPIGVAAAWLLARQVRS